MDYPLSDWQHPGFRERIRPRRLAILGATGSIGRSTLELVRLFPDALRVVAITAHRNVQGVIEWIRTVGPKYVVLTDPAAADRLRGAIGDQYPDLQIWSGTQALRTVATLPEIDTVISAIVGAAGLEPTLCALRAGKRVCLANKESLVIGGALIRQTLREHSGCIIPVDSEHSALFQVMLGEDRQSIERLWLTASGGPFLHRPLETFDAITVEEALRHPRWKMGPKITIDSATLMNKGLEIVEAHYLFDWPIERIEVVIHPQSIVHSMIEFVDGAFKAQMSLPDMRLPILYALTYPERWTVPVPRWQPGNASVLEFFPPEERRFPCLWLARRAIQAGPSYTIALNAANEVAVQAFLQGQIRFTEIAPLIDAVLQQHIGQPVHTLEDIWAVDRWARAVAQQWIRSRMEEKSFR